MPFPESPREVYAENPLEEVICQIRFPAVLKISATAPVDFQDAIRSDYPWYEEQVGGPALPKEITDMLPPGLPIPRLSQQPEHRFSTESRGRSITLGQEFIAVAENNYQDWSNFRKEVKQAERVLRETYAPSFYTRVGLRYRDVLIRENYGLGEVPWSELLNPAFMGVLGDTQLSDDVQESQAHSLLRIPGVHGGFVLIQHGLAVKEPEGSPAYLIDSDFFTNERCNPNAALQALDRFNKWGGHLFRWAATDKLRAALRPMAG
jgi:uncharacterized protein (TIGR04255 family)